MNVDKPLIETILNDGTCVKNGGPVPKKFQEYHKSVWNEVYKYDNKFYLFVCEGLNSNSKFFQGEITEKEIKFL